MNPNPRIPLTIDGKPCVLAFDMAAAITLKKEFKIGFKELEKLHAERATRDEIENIELLRKFVWAMTRSMDDPPTLKQIDRMSFTEVRAAGLAVARAFTAGTEGPPGESRGGADPAPAASATAGTGTPRSRRPSTASASRRRSSGG